MVRSIAAGLTLIFVALCLPGFAAAQTAQAHQVARDDGSRVSYFLGAANGRQDVILVLQGTGCADVSKGEALAWLSRAARLIAPQARPLTINQYGVPGAAQTDGCPVEFWRRATLHQRVLDALQVVSDLRRSNWWTGRIIIVGGSEGGAVAAMVAPLIPETVAVVVYSSGTGATVAELIGQSLPPEMSSQVADAVRSAKSNPTDSVKFVGLSYAWWADAADVMPARSLALAGAPVLIVHGALDKSSPVATARAGRDFLLASGKGDVNYVEYPLYDHFMMDKAGVDHSEDVMGSIAKWLAGLPSHVGR